MAEDNDPSSRTEEPTPRRLQEARRRGEVAKSADLAQWASFAASAGVIAVAGGWMAQDLLRKLEPFVERPDSIELSHGGAVEVMRIALAATGPALAVVLGASAAGGVFGNVVQQGFIWSVEKLKPELSKISPLSGLKRLFGIDGLMQFARSVLKVAVVAVAVWLMIKPHQSEAARLVGLEPAAILPFAAAILRSITLAVVVVLGVGAALDWLWQRQRFMSRMRMSREELKEDMRQSEGDPHVKARLRQLRAERARRRMMQAVPKATVVVANPTHYAVALHYEQGETEAPVCVAKGMDRLALKIREVAEENNVPVVEDPPLARALFAAVEIDHVIPVQHYQAVAKVIGFVMGQAERRRRGRAFR